MENLTKEICPGSGDDCEVAAASEPGCDGRVAGTASERQVGAFLTEWGGHEGTIKITDEPIGAEGKFTDGWW